MWTGRKEPFGHIRRLSRSRGALSPVGAVAQRRSRASGVTRLSGVGYPGVLILVLEGDPLARRSAVLCKSFVFSSLPIRKVLILFGAVFFQRVYPQDRRSYYLFCTT